MAEISIRWVENLCKIYKCNGKKKVKHFRNQECWIISKDGQIYNVYYLMQS